jgi:HTH-type transcriptional repressor of NAD biosynthesis genes
MKKIGIFVGKFLPLHRGHIQSIIEASTMVDHLFVVGSYRNNEKTTINGKHVTAGILETWLSEQFSSLSHITVKVIDETSIPEYPNGWPEWSRLVKETIDINETGIHEVEMCGDKSEWHQNDYIASTISLCVFGGEPNTDKENYERYFAPCTYIAVDPSRHHNNIRATQIRENLYGYWDYLPSIVRQFFVKKVLVTGTESCGKSSLVKYLAKIYNTSWSEEVGRDYAKIYCHGNEKLLTTEDFNRIAWLQYEQDLKAFKTANKVVFIDTDALVTDYYSRLYHKGSNAIALHIATGGNYNSNILLNRNKWDLILFMEPDVPWVADGQRMTSDQKDREMLSGYLKQEYISRYDCKIVSISGNYAERLNKAILEVDELGELCSTKPAKSTKPIKPTKVSEIVTVTAYDITDVCRFKLFKVLNECSEAHLDVFKKMYSYENLTLSLVKVVNSIPHRELPHAIDQVKRTLESETQELLHPGFDRYKMMNFAEQNPQEIGMRCDNCSYGKSEKL